MQCATRRGQSPPWLLKLGTCEVVTAPMCATRGLRLHVHACQARNAPRCSVVIPTKLNATPMQRETRRFFYRWEPTRDDRCPPPCQAQHQVTDVSGVADAGTWRRQWSAPCTPTNTASG